MNLVLLLWLAACGGGEELPATGGKWMPRRGASETQLLEAIGYVGEGGAFSGKQGVTLHDPRAEPGRNLVVSGHAAEASLIDMEGVELHRWSADFSDAFPLPAWWIKGTRTEINAHHWRRAKVLPNGDLIAVFGGLGMVRLDRDSNIKWGLRNHAHHDLDFTDDGRIVVLTREGRVVPYINPTRPIFEDFITVLDADGQVLKQVSLLDALERSPYHDLFDRSAKRHGDIFHTNTVQVLRGTPIHPAFQPGRVLTSMRELNAIGVVDLDEGRFVWVYQDSFAAQHDPRVVDNGRLLLFDNRGAITSSRVLEYQLRPEPELSWSFRGSSEYPFYSEVCGAARRLDNGNTLVVETDAGHAFELTRQHEVVWEYYNPHTAGEDDELVAKLFDLIRLPPDYGAAWLSP